MMPDGELDNLVCSLAGWRLATSLKTHVTQFYLGHVSDGVGIIHELPLVHFNFP